MTIFRDKCFHEALNDVTRKTNSKLNVSVRGRIRGHSHEPSDCFEYPPKPSLIRSTSTRPGPGVPLLKICEMKMETITANKHRKCES